MMSSTAVQTVPQLPDAEALEEAWTKFADLNEHVLDPIIYGVYKALSFEGDQKITYDQIGQLGAWAWEIESFCVDLKKHTANIKEACVRDLPPIARAGSNPHQPRFNEWGRLV
jgi:hypothetical protein